MDQMSALATETARVPQVTNSTSAPSSNSNTSLIYSNITESTAPDDRVRTDHVYIMIFTYISPFLILIGTVGNILSLFVMRSKYFRKAPSSFILSALACTDTGVLLCGVTRHWVIAITDYAVDIRHMALVSCWTHFFFIYVLWELSSWSLALLTLERMASVRWPFKAKEMFSKKRMIIAWTTVALSLSVINVHWFVTVEYRDGRCYDVDASRVFMHHIWPWVDLLLSSLVPLLIIVTCNIIIISTLLKARKLRKDQMKVTTDDESASITAMLIGISITFFVATMPACVYLIGYNYWPTVTYEQQYAGWTTWGVSLMAYYCSSSTNFIVYCISGAKFRRALVAVLCCREMAKPGGTVASKTSMSMVSNTNATKAISPSQVDTTVM